MEENSLFSGTNVDTSSENIVKNNDALIHSLIVQGIGRDIRNDDSEGKINVLKRMAPKTRSLKRLIKGLEEEGDELLIKGPDDAVDILDVIYGIVNSKFLLEPEHTHVRMDL
ncbi:unknown [Choristoneura occidentalis granulovirus]|uniref:P12 n=1 Tax=Choristoneura occidentalis granulovirus TaxID=364745 RepID=Q1A4N1_9BBAC|nr:unknown [Choristoneura fumiferana granulovirus]ABC61199.1 unknown [Choristoneura fumiferana granulovirus]